MNRLLSLAAVLLAAVPAVAQRDAKIPDPDPELERKTFVVPDGFEVNLFAADPLLAKPVQMNFDPKGRLWVAGSEVYPQIKPGEAANDKVLILEDTDGDGRADKTTVFADGLLIPTGVAPGDGGCYVADSTVLVHFSDPDPVTGKARKKRIVLSGFGTEDTHHILHTFRWGPDGCLYFNQSVYIHSHIETPHGVRHLNAGGIWKFRPETNQLDVFVRGFWNPWGTRFDRWGQAFATDGANGEGINHLIPGAAYPAAKWDGRLLSGLNPGSPKHCGLEVLSGRHLPDEYQGNLVTNDFRGHRVCRFQLKPDGAGYISQEKQELIKTGHPAFRPIDVCMGPDGAVYVADWYNPIIQHGEVDFRDPRRDKTHGRIWRITVKNRPLVPRPKLDGATVPELLEALKAPEDWTRQQARRVLQERGKEAVLPALDAWGSDRAAGTKTDAERLEVLWVAQAINVADKQHITPVLSAVDGRVRAAAYRVLGDRAADVCGSDDILTRGVADDTPQVRLEAVRALAKINFGPAAESATAILDKPMDRWLDYALWLTLRELAPVWLPALQAGKLDFGGDPAKVIFALKAAGSGDVVKPLVALLKAGKLAKDKEAEALLTVAQLGGPADLGYVLEHATPEARPKLLPAVEEAARTRKVGPPPNFDGLLYFELDVDAGPVRQAACRLVGLWKDESMRRMLEKIAQGKGMAQAGGGPASADDRRAACEGLARLGGGDSTRVLVALAGPAEPPAVRRMAVAALAASDPKSAAGLAVETLAATAAGDDPAEVVAAFAQRKDGAAALARALAGQSIPADAAKVAVRVAKAAAQPDAGLIDALTRAGKLAEPKPPLAKAEYDALVADVYRLGDPARGEAVFRRADMQCLKCHAIAGAGGAVGPDMTSIGASAPVDYLVDSVLYPNKAIKEGYHSLVVSTVDGKSVTGVKVRETKTELALRDAEDRELVIPLGDIDARKEGRSLMPEGLADPLTRAEFVDLVRFLSALGKVGDGYAATPGRVVRRWEAVQPTKEAYSLTNRDRIGAVANPKAAGLAWAPAYSLVSGDLPVGAVPAFRPHATGPAYAAVRFALDVSAGGPVKLLFADPAGLGVWLDGVPAEAGREVVLDVKPGVRTVTVAVDTGVRKSPLRVEVDEVPASPARVRIVGGK